MIKTTRCHEPLNSLAKFHFVLLLISSKLMLLILPNNYSLVILTIRRCYPNQIYKEKDGPQILFAINPILFVDTASLQQHKSYLPFYLRHNFPHNVAIAANATPT